MATRLESFVNVLWYGPRHILHWIVFLLLLPLSLIFYLIVVVRRKLFTSGVLDRYTPATFTVVVGNITVGGTGKTPVTIALAEALLQKGYSVGIVSRGYGGRAGCYPLEVLAETEFQVCGDEPLLMKRRLPDVPVWVDPDRGRAAAALLDRQRVDVLLCDDGLQHYRLGRHLELVVIDESRGTGNGLMLPAGPLREPLSRIKNKIVLCNRSEHQTIPKGLAAWLARHAQLCRPFALNPQAFVRLGSQESLSARDAQAYFAGHPVLAVAGIGNPARFYYTLDQLGLVFAQRSFDDHHVFTESDFASLAPGTKVIMTEKDAVKCGRLTQVETWFLRVSLELDSAVVEAICNARSLPSE